MEDLDLSSEKPRCSVFNGTPRTCTRDEYMDMVGGHPRTTPPLVANGGEQSSEGARGTALSCVCCLTTRTASAGMPWPCHAMPCRIFLCFTSPFSRSPHRTSPCPPGFSPVRADPNMERARIDSLFTKPMALCFSSVCLDISSVSEKRLLRLFQRHASFDN